MSKLTTRITRPQALSAAEIELLFQLYATYYGGTDSTLFGHDLASKDHLLLLLDEAHHVRGFSTLQLLCCQHQNTPIRAVFSGDTIIDHRFWGEQTLPLAWCRLVGQIKAQAPDIPLYWLLIVKGDRTYRYLNVFSKSYYPNRRHATPSETQDLINHLASQRFGQHYQPQTGLVHYPQSRGHLKSPWLNTPGNNLEAQFFAQQNPHHAQGDELVCLTLLEETNLRSFALRGFREGLAAGALEPY